VQKFAKQLQKDIKTIPPSVMKAFTTWEWPGNIRELENLVERSVILTRGKSLDAPLVEMRKLSREGHDRETKDSRQEEIAEIVRSTLQALNWKQSLADEPGKKLAEARRKKSAERVKKQREEIVRALALSKGRVGGSDGAAARLGINRTTLLARIRKLGIDPRDYAG
jgi:transcriptional regulator with GAF, ATPase, and Fis domain